jgi:hypothetical protein
MGLAMKNQQYGKFIDINKPFHAVITIKPIDPDLAQELHREEISDHYIESEIDALIRMHESLATPDIEMIGDYQYNLSRAFQSIGYQLSKGWEITGKQIITKPEPMKNKHFEEAVKAFHDSIEAISKEFPIPERPTSNLAGKCAIQISNEREFKLLMEHYHEKGWKSEDDSNLTECIPAYGYPVHFEYSNYPKHGDLSFDYDKIIPFADFAKEVGITVPVLVMKSEDGVDLYEGDKVFEATNYSKDGWKLVEPSGSADGSWTQSGNGRQRWVVNTDSKAFSTKEAAEAWIKEQNRPKEILLLQDQPAKVKVTQDGYISSSPTPNDKTMLTNHHFSGEELEAIYNAYKSLQP